MDDEHHHPNAFVAPPTEEGDVAPPPVVEEATTVVTQEHHHHHVGAPTVASGTTATLDQQTEQAVASAVTEALEQEAALAMVANKRPLPVSLAVLPDVGPPPQQQQRKKRTKWNEHRHVYKGVTRRTCMCGSKECFPVWKQWIDLGDNKRQGYYRLGWAPCRDTPKAMERIHHRDVMYRHLLGVNSPRYAKDDPRRTVKQFIAYHHFPPEILQDGNKGPMPTVPGEIAEKIEAYSVRDKFMFTEEHKEMYHPIPSYSAIQMQEELRDSHNTKRARVQSFLKKTRENPEVVADDYLKIEDELSRTVKTLEDTKKALEELKETNTELIRKYETPATAPIKHEEEETKVVDDHDRHHDVVLQPLVDAAAKDDGTGIM